MSIVQISRAASVDEIVAEMDRRGKVIERLEARLAHIDGIYPGAIDNLLHHQRQLDMDGIEVAVSRQALCEVLAGIDAVLAAAPSPSSEAVGWRPIESAPKDGTKILYRNRFKSIGFCHWDEGYDDDDQPCWWDNEADDEVCPVVWLPADALPAFPSAPVSHGGGRGE